MSRIIAVSVSWLVVGCGTGAAIAFFLAVVLCGVTL
jgi:hypothetical protein